MTISELQKEVHETAIDKGWYAEPRTFGDLIALAHSELSEALEAFRSYPVDASVAFYDPDSEGGKPEGIAIELADAVIRILDMAEHYGINLEHAIQRKMEYNRTRPMRHGGKAI